MTLDPVARILKLRTTGYLTVEDVRRYRQDLSAMRDDARRRYARMRMFVDSTDGRVQPAAVIEEFGRIPSIIVGPDDRMAVVTGSTLALLQVKRMLRNDQERAFLDAGEAMAWLAED